MKDKSEKPPGYVFGRPTKYKPEYCQLLVEQAALGKRPNQVAADLRIRRETFWEWGKEYPDFSNALALAHQIHECYMEEMAQENMFSKDFNTRIWELIMKCQHKWRDKDVPNNVIIAVDSNSDVDKVAEMAKKIRKNMDF